MIKKDELQAQRNELFAHSSDTLARIKELDEQIKELGKPESRHGDYGLDDNNQPCLLLCAQGSNHGDGPMRRCSKDWLYEYEITTDNFRIKTRLGNIFDDIAKRGEELSKFTVSGGFEIGFKAEISGYAIGISLQEGGIWNFTLDETQKIIDGLQGVLNKAKNKSK